MPVSRGLSFCILVWLAVTVPAGAADKPSKQELGSTFCAVGEVLKYDGVMWVCAADKDSPTTSLDWTAITGRPAGLDDGDDDHDALGGLNCAQGEVAKSDGNGGWTCQTDEVGIPPADTLAELGCAVGDVARFDGSEWVCSDAVSRLELLAFGKRVFISSVFFDGDFGGLDGADAACQDLSIRAGLPGKYRAWLSDSTGSPVSRFTHSTTPYMLVDGTIIAENWADLVDGQLNDAIYLQEDGSPSPAISSLLGQVWTSTDEAGSLNTAGGGDFHCENWSTSDGTIRGLVGSPNSADTPGEDTEVLVGADLLLRLGWTRLQTEITPGSGTFGEAIPRCESQLPIYCFQQ